MLKDKITRSAMAGLWAGLLLMLVEALDRMIIIAPFFHDTSERLRFISALTFIPAGNIFIGIALALSCALAAQLIKSRQQHEWRRLPVNAVAISVPFILLAIFLPAIYTNGFREILAGLNDRVAKLAPIIAFSTVVLCLLIYFGALALAWLESAQFEKLAANKISAAAIMILMIMIACAFYFIDARIFVGRYLYSFHYPAALISIAASFIFGLVLAQRLKDQRALAAVIGIFIFAVALLAGYRFDSNQSVKALFWRRGVVAKKYLAFAQHLWDFDRDGFSPLLGGGDCNDFDRSINPLAVEIPNNGKDENCNGSDYADAVDHKVNFAALNQQPLTDPPVANILFITVDCLRADHLGCYGYQRKTSPNIDRFAARSVVFDNAYSLGTNTGHSFTGIARSGYGEAIFDDAIPTVAETLAANGRATFAITSPQTDNWLQKQGWESYKTIMLKGLQKLVHDKDKYWNSRRLTDKVIEYLDQQKDKPFYAWVHYNDLHAKNESYKKVGKHEFGDKPLDVYDSNLAFTDDHMGRLFDYLEKSGLLEKTLVIVSADHGEEFLDHGQQFHNGRLYREQTHVPMILWYPGVKAQHINDNVSSIDLAPTFLRAAGILPSPAYAGVDMKMAIAGLTKGREIFLETPRNVPQGDFFCWAIMDGDWRLIYDIVGNTYELFNDRDDPMERNNLIDRAPEKARALKAALAHWFDEQSRHKGYRRWATF